MSNESKQDPQPNQNDNAGAQGHPSDLPGLDVVEFVFAAVMLVVALAGMLTL